MIYNSTITATNESDIMSLLENADDRFENYSIAEATAITIGEQEQNWTRFMKGIGLSELSTVMEGQEVVYEGARLQSFITKAKAYFKMALSKLAEITKSFISKVDQIFRLNDSFVKKYEKVLSGMTVPSDFEFEGYKFQNLEKPTYKDANDETVTSVTAAKIVSEKESKWSKEVAESELVPGVSGDDSFTEKLNKYFYGEKEKTTLKANDIHIKSLLDNIKNTKEMKKKATTSYKEAASKIKKIIKSLEKDEKKALKEPNDHLETSQKIDQAYNILISYWKAYSSCAHQKHGAYLRVLGAQNRQSRAICAKLASTKYKEKGKADRETLKARTEGFVNTDAFLGAVEFI